MKFDDIIHEIGDFGTYQRRSFFLVSLVGVAWALSGLSHVSKMKCTKKEVANIYCPQGRGDSYLGHHFKGAQYRVNQKKYVIKLFLISTAKKNMPTIGVTVDNLSYLFCFACFRFFLLHFSPHKF